MKKNPPPTLSQFLSSGAGVAAITSISDYLAKGAACVTPPDRKRLRKLLPLVRTKAGKIGDSTILRDRILLLTQFVEESGPDADSPGHKEATFALYYFLKGYDLLPDSVPEIGLLDDAQLVEAVLRRNEHDLRSHWAACNRTWATGT